MSVSAKISGMGMFLLGSVFAYGSMQDRLARFSTQGPDCYTDGTIVRDGECYALVWSPTGTTFSGFNADGTPVSSNDRVVLAGALAQGGRCRDAVFQIPAKEYEALEGGEWAVCLVDTRRVDGVPAGVKDGKPVRVNRWGIVSDGAKIADAGSVRTRLASASVGVRRVEDNAPYQAVGARAGNLSAVPPNLPPPEVTAMEVGGGVVALAVKNTVPYLTYTVSSSSTPAPGGFVRDKYADRRDGAADAKAEIVLETDASGGSRFFKVIRAE